MSDTSFGTNDSSTLKLWARKWWIAAKEKSFYYTNGFVGSEDEGRYVIIEKGELKKEKGDRIRVHQYQQLSGAGISGENTLEGQEEPISQYYFDVTIDQIRNAVRLGGSLSEQRHGDDGLRAYMKEALDTWMADYIDDQITTGLVASPTKALYGGDATSTANIEAGDYMTLDLWSKCVTKADKATPLIEPVPKGGDRAFVGLMAHDCAFDLTEQSPRWEQVQKDAQVRGNGNPIFKNALGTWKGVAMFAHNTIPLATTWGSGGNLPGATNLFLGVGAGAIAYAKRQKWNEKTFDYGDKFGLAVGSIHGFSKAKFNSNDHATIALYTYRTNN